MPTPHFWSKGQSYLNECPHQSCVRWHQAFKHVLARVDGTFIYEGGHTFFFSVHVPVRSTAHECSSMRLQYVHLSYSSCINNAWTTVINGKYGSSYMEAQTWRIPTYNEGTVAPCSNLMLWGWSQRLLSLQKLLGKVVGVSGLPKVGLDVIVHLKHWFHFQEKADECCS